MRLIKYIVIFLVILSIGYSFGWYYIAGKITTDINDNYAGKKLDITGLNQEEFFISFDKATSKGFPFEMAVNLEGWREESKSTSITYSSPVQLGYNLVSQSAYISYDGEIIAAYKPLESNYGAILKIKDYLIKLSVPLSKELFVTIANMKDPIEMINHVGDLSISTKEVQIFDKQENELFYDKDHERLKFSFVPAKHYENLQDLLNNIPQEYHLHYVVRTKPVKFMARRIPVSLFYGFSVLPAGFDATASISVKTEAKTIQELSKTLEIKADCTLAGAHIDVPSLKMEFQGGIDLLKGRNMKLLIDSKIRLKEGLFDELFAKYDSVRHNVLAAPGGHLINQEMSYIIANKDAFRFKDLENSNYDLNLDMVSSHTNATSLVKLNNFSIYSGDSGFKLNNESVMKMTQQSWNSNGVLLIKNYPAVVDFSSGYIYRFGKFRFLNDKARELYIKINKEFLKQISDHPESTSNDLSFEYSYVSNDPSNAKIGSVTVGQIAELYQLMLYKKLFESVDPHGDILNQMKKILPDLNENDPMFKKLLPSITGKSIKELIPTDAKEAIEKIVPIEDLKKKVGKDLLKGLLK
jgi:hypothetical protein